MRVYISQLLYDEVLSRTSSNALCVGCFSLCSYLYGMSVQYEDDWTPYSSRKGQRIYTAPIYTRMIALLKDIGAIEQTRSYRIGQNPKSIRLADAYRDVIALDFKASALERRLARISTEGVPSTDVHRWLREVYLDRATFSPDAWDMVVSFPYRSDDQRTAYHYHYDRFKTKAPSYSVGASGRVTYVPNLIPKVLRRAILIDGEPVVEIDVVSSQPRLALTLLPKDHPEYAPFEQLLDSGMLYEAVASWVPDVWDDSQLKPQFFRQILYGAKHAHHSYPLWGEFEARYPGFAAIIAAEKRADKRVLPLKLQGIEAQIMLDGVVAECAAEGIPVLGIHDGVAVKVKDAEAVARMVDKHWTRVTGKAPRVRVDGQFRVATGS